MASDVDRDGIGLELYKNGKMVGEIFRSDREKMLTISLFESDLPLNEIERLVFEAKKRLLPFVED
jgi:hypothetical protein